MTTTPSIHFNPSPAEADQVIDKAIASDNYLQHIAEEHHTTVEALTLWLARPDIAERLANLESIFARRIRLSASARLGRIVSTLTNILDEYDHEVSNVLMRRDDLRFIEQRRKSRETARRACALLIRLANFHPSRGGPALAGGRAGSTQTSGSGVPPVHSSTSSAPSHATGFRDRADTSASASGAMERPAPHGTIHAPSSRSDAPQPLPLPLSPEELQRNQRGFSASALDDPTTDPPAVEVRRNQTGSSASAPHDPEADPPEVEVRRNQNPPSLEDLISQLSDPAVLARLEQLAAGAHLDDGTENSVDDDNERRRQASEVDGIAREARAHVGAEKSSLLVNDSHDSPAHHRNGTLAAVMTSGP